MKSKKLQVDYDFDFDLFGLISSAKGFKLAWSLNNSLSIELVNIPDIELMLRDNRKQKIIAYEFETQNSKYILFHNRMKDLSGSDSGYVLPEMGKIDYFLRIDGDIYPNSPEKVLESLRELSTIEYALRVDTSKLKSRENLLLY